MIPRSPILWRSSRPKKEKRLFGKEANSPSATQWLVERNIGDVASEHAQLELPLRKVKRCSKQTNGHNHPVDGVEAPVERVKHKLQK